MAQTCNGCVSYEPAVTMAMRLKVLQCMPTLIDETNITPDGIFLIRAAENPCFSNGGML